MRAYGMWAARVQRRALYRGIFVVWPCAYAAILLVPALSITLVMLLALGFPPAPAVHCRSQTPRSVRGRRAIAFG